MMEYASLLQQVRDIEDQRSRAMIAVDRDVLDRLLHDDLCWIHGSGRIQDKSALLETLARDRPYRDLVISDHHVRDIGTGYISTGLVEIALAAADAPPPYFNVFTNLWLRAGDRARLIHSQSTRCPAPGSC